MKKVLAMLLLSVFLVPSFAQEVAPDTLVKTVTLDVVDLIAKDKEIRAGSRAKLVEVIEAKVLPHFNFASMTALAMGQGWGKASPEQRKRLTDEFKTLLVRTYASALAAYSEQKFDFRPLRAKPSDTDVTVNVRVLQPGAQPVTIDYSMEKTGSGWKVYDVMVGGAGHEHVAAAGAPTHEVRRTTRPSDPLGDTVPRSSATRRQGASVGDWRQGPHIQLAPGSARRQVPGSSARQVSESAVVSSYDSPADY